MVLDERRRPEKRMKEFLALFFYSRRGAEKESREPM
jgi:hypothetical protein